MNKLTWEKTLSFIFLEQYGWFRHQLKELKRWDFAKIFSSFLELHILRRLNHSVCPSCLRARANRRPSENSNANSQNTCCPIQSFMCSTFRTLSSTSWCTIFSNSKRKESIDDRRFLNPKCFDWTNSLVTLAWIKNITRKWKTFVLNRAVKFQRITPSENSKFVPTENNPVIAHYKEF